MKSWLPDLSEFYDPFTPLALEDDRESEEPEYGSNGHQLEKSQDASNNELYQQCNQNFENRMKISESEKHLKRLKAEVISQYHEYSELLAQLQKYAGEGAIERQYKQVRRHTVNTLLLSLDYFDHSAHTVRLCPKGKRGYDSTLLEYISDDEFRASTTDGSQSSKRRRVENTTEDSDLTTASSSTAITAMDTGHGAITNSSPGTSDTPPTILEEECSKSCNTVALDVDFQTLDLGLAVRSAVRSGIGSLETNLRLERSKLEQYLERYDQVLKNDARHDMFLQKLHKQSIRNFECLSERLAMCGHITPKPSLVDQSYPSIACSAIRAST
jgi:hypothetical protein